MTGFYDEIVASNGVFKYYVNGEWKESSSGKTVGVLNPTTNKNDFKVQGKSICAVVLCCNHRHKSEHACLVAACTQDEVNAVYNAAKKAQRPWARTPLWKRAELLHKVDALLKENAQPIADALVKEIAKPAKDAKTEVVRSGDFVSYTAEEGVRVLGAGKLLNSDSFPGQERSKMCLVQKVYLISSVL